MLRITKVAAEDRTVLQIAGRLSAGSVTELERICREVDWPLSLDLSELRHADEGGLAAIRELVARGAELERVPPFIALLLERREP